ncbi:hypothetical protein GOP47_0008891 [Adiantum capillus-veneris]|uniref:Pentatricopeptide repeat-containing protein n=1 Tax=Adiantum capillus-veneris TaxID=13818 RepID=A0A9D4ZKT4_ADICA|nr:hypothetical protein GOP47_0008891 [Adiantum capillus-veneris]
MQSNTFSIACFFPPHIDPFLVVSRSQEITFQSQVVACRILTKGPCGWEFLGVQAYSHPLKRASSTEFPSLEGLSYMLQENVQGKVDNGEALRMHLLLCFLGLEAMLGNHLVPMFIKCGNLPHAQQTFYKIAEPNLYSWTSLINGYVDAAEFQHALDLFQTMQDHGLHSGIVTLLAVVKACGRLKLLDRGREIHMEIAKSGYLDDSFLSSTVVDMYARSGSLGEARAVFYKLSNRDTITWNTLIAGYVDFELSCEALLCLQKMEQEGTHADESTFVYAIKACTNFRALEEGQKFHLKVIEEGFERDPYVGNTLVDFYGKVGFLIEAEAVFDDLLVQDVVPWTALIAAYADYGYNKEALENYKRMLEDSVFPNEVTYACILRSCSNAGDLETIHSIHSIITKNGQEGNCHLENILVDVYASSGCFIEAHSVFNSLLTRDVVSWTALLGGYVEFGLGEAALHYLEQMFLDGISPNPVTLICSLKACNSSLASDIGKQVHMDILKMGYESDLTVGNALVDMYARCASFVEAWWVFDTLPVRNVVTWNILITACTDSEFDEKAAHCIEQMALEGVLPSSITLCCTLKCCSRIGAIERGRTIHIRAVKEGIDGDYAVGNALLSLYAKCGLFLDARKVLDEMANRDVVAWTTLIGGYSEHGFGKEALMCLGEMHLEKVSANSITLDSSLRACITVSSPIVNIRQIHAEIVNKGFCLGTCLGDLLVMLYVKNGFLEEGRMVHDNLLLPSSVSSNALIEGYAKTGDFEEAKFFFNNLQVRDVYSWTALVSGCVGRGVNEQALYFFELMRQNDVSPDATSFACGLQACGNLWIATKGQELHSQIVKQGFEQDPFLGNCLLNMYAKFGLIDEAQHIFEKLVIRDIISWTALATGYASLSLRDQVYVCLKQMQSEHVSPNQVFWNSIIGAFAENDDNETASMVMLEMQEQGHLPDCWTITNVLKACSKAADLVAGKILHAQVAGSRAIDSTCAAALIDMYGKCGRMADAQQSFDAFPTRDLATWNALIDGYSRQGVSLHVFSLLETMQIEGIQPNETTYLSILMVCGHDGLITMGQTSFETMCKMWNIEPTIKHFNSMAILLGRTGQLGDVLVMLEEMPFSPDLATLRNLLTAGRLCGDVYVGIHAFDAVCDEEFSRTFSYF